MRKEIEDSDMGSKQELWEKALRTMSKEGDFKAAVLSFEDGLPLVSAPVHYEDETAAAMVTLLNETAKQINQQLRLPQVDEISIVYDDRTRLVCRYFIVDGHELLLMVLAPPDQSDDKRGRTCLALSKDIPITA
jgi:predicted regulator of Ras-like GTPase activity (Roadblock/LC7/MglB family)